MGLIQKLKNKSVFLDTAPLIYYIEENPKYASVLNKVFLNNSKGEFVFLTSVVTLLEVLVQPMRQNEMRLAEQYQDILCNSPSLHIFDLSVEIATEAARLRGKYGLKTPDAIQVATALFGSADYFLTNDIRLKAIKEIEIVILDDLLKR